MNLDSVDPIGFWGSQSNVITVAATDNQDHLSSYSNYSAHDVDLGAPGTDILTTGTFGSYVVVSGTSYSAPMVSGAIALLASYVPTASVSQIRDAIMASVDPLASLNGVTKHRRAAQCVRCARETLMRPADADWSGGDDQFLRSKRMGV